MTLQFFFLEKHEREIRSVSNPCNLLGRGERERERERWGEREREGERERDHCGGLCSPNEAGTEGRRRMRGRD